VADTDSLEAGLYEAAVTVGLRRLLERLNGREADTRGIEPADADLIVAHHLVPLIRRAVAAQPTEHRVANAVALANDLARVLRTHAPGAVDDADELADIAEVLLAITPASSLPGQNVDIRRPTAPLSESDLLTNARGEPSIGHEIALELESADEVDLICAFIRWSGIRQLRDPIQRLTSAGKPVRIVTIAHRPALHQPPSRGLARDALRPRVPLVIVRHHHAVHGARTGDLRAAPEQPTDGDHVAAAHADARRAVRGRPRGGGVAVDDSGDVNLHPDHGLAPADGADVFAVLLQQIIDENRARGEGDDRGRTARPWLKR
jgi:hypothetical protein